MADPDFSDEGEFDAAFAAGMPVAIFSTGDMPAETASREQALKKAAAEKAADWEYL